MRKVKKRYIMLFIAPSAIIYIYFMIIPAIKAFFVSLTDWNGYSSAKKFIGLGNFKSILSDQNFYIAIGNTLAITFIGGFFVFGICLLFLFILHRNNFKGKKFFSNFFFFPNMISMSALGVMWAFIFDSNIGLLRNIFKLIGADKLSKIAWLGSRGTAMPAIISVAVWTSMGYYLLLLISGSDKIPETYYEATAIDGAGSVRTFFQITLPMMWDVLVIAMTLWIINSMKYFEIVWSMTYGGPANQTQILGTYLYVTAFGTRNQMSSDLGKGTAIGVISFILMIAFITVFRKTAEKEAIEY